MRAAPLTALAVPVAGVRVLGVEAGGSAALRPGAAHRGGAAHRQHHAQHPLARASGSCLARHIWRVI